MPRKRKLAQNLILKNILIIQFLCLNINIQIVIILPSVYYQTFFYKRVPLEYRNDTAFFHWSQKLLKYSNNLIGLI